MTATLEERLARAGEQLDRLIEAEPRPARQDSPPAGDVIRRRPPRWTIAAVAAIACVVAVVVWTNARSPHRSTTVPGTDVGAPAAVDTIPDPTEAAPQTTAAAAPTTVPAVSATTDAPAAVGTAPLAIGTSVMLGAVDALEAGGFQVVAQANLQAADQVETLRELAASGAVGDVVVVETGVNGPVAAEQYDEMAQLLADVPTVVFLTAHADRQWVDQNNDLVWLLARTYANVTVLDWDGLVAFGNIPGIGADGIHLGSDAARQAYANFVFDAVGHPELAQPLTGYRRLDQLGQLLPSLVPLPEGADQTDLPRLTAPGLDAAVSVQGEQVCITSYDDVGSGSTCAPRSTGIVELLVASEVPTPATWVYVVHQAEVGVVGDDRCVITTSAPASGLAISGCAADGFGEVIHLTFTLPDGTSILATVFDGGSSTGLPGPDGMTTRSLEAIARRLPAMDPVEGGWGSKRFLVGTVELRTTDGRPCIWYSVDGTSIGGCPRDGQRTGLVSLVSRVEASGPITIVLLHDASVTVTAVEGCTIERLDIADAGLAFSGCIPDAGVTQVVLDVAHDARADQVVIPLTP